eukprot:12276478-Prorocentrum_lima.AAC.1
MIHVYEEGGNKLHGIARYPIDKWMAAGGPVITVKHWVKLCMKIAAGDLNNLGTLMSVCTDMDAKL